MKVRLYPLLFALVSLFFFPAAAFADNVVGRMWTVEALPMPQLEDSTRYTVNPDAILDPVDVDSIDAVCRLLRSRYGVEMVCVVVDRFAGDDVYAWGDSLFTRYGFGRKGADTGLLVVVARQSRDWHIFPGKGLEGTLPDIICNRIGTRVMVPLLREGDYGEALKRAAVTVYGIVSEAPEFEAFTAAADDEGDWRWPVGFLSAVLAGGGAIAYFGRRKCPRCKAYMNVTQRRLVKVTRRQKIYSVHYRCSKCGYEDDRTEHYDLPSASDAGVIAGSVLGGMRGGGGGGGFAGGSFGGGSFGGGGAGGKF